MIYTSGSTARPKGILVSSDMVATSLLVLALLLTADCAWTDALLTRVQRPAAVSGTQFAAELAGSAALVLGIWLARARRRCRPGSDE